MAGVNYPVLLLVLDSQDPWAVNWFLDGMPMHSAGTFRFDVSNRRPMGTELLDCMDPHNVLPRD